MRKIQLPAIVLILALLFGIRPGLSGKAAPNPAAEAEAPESSRGQPATQPIPPVWEALCKLNPKYGSGWYLNNLATLEGMAPHGDPPCLHDQNGAEIHLDVVSVVAAIADPVHTHLGLDFDRTVSAIQAAAEEAEYLPYLNAVPWPPPQEREAGSRTPSETNPMELEMRITPVKSPTGGKLVSAQASVTATSTTTGRDYEYPGALILRRFEQESPTYLVVFLVPELPTSAIDQTTFLTAVRISHIIARDSKTIYLAGPNFSGSVKQLASLLAVVNQGSDGVPSQMEAVSGPVTNATNPFSSETEGSFLTLQAQDQEAIGRFVYAMSSTSRYKAKEIAVLTEEGTEYGESEKYRPKDWLLLHFPREISRLRNASSAATAPASTGGQQDQTSGQSAVSLDWRDPHPLVRDDIRNYGKQTPVSDETVLASLASTIRAKNIKALGILATDPLDSVFLLQFFRKSSPDVRLFVRDPDLLYFRTPDVGSLTGVLVINNFPLIPQNQFWTAAGEHVHPLTFSSASEESQYNAFTLLLLRIESDTKRQIFLPPNRPRLLEMGWPAASPAAPLTPSSWPLWLGVAGTTGYFPVRILEPVPQSDGAKIKEDQVAQYEDPAALHQMDVGKPPYATIVLLLLITMVGTLHCVWFLIPKTVPRSLSDEFDFEGDSLPATKALCHVMAILEVTIANVIAGSSFVFFYRAASSSSGNSFSTYSLLALLVLAATVGFLVVAVLTLWERVLCPWWQGRKDAHDVLRRSITSVDSEYKHMGTLVWGGMFSGAVLVVILAWWIAATILSQRYENAFLHFRDLYLASGVAPVVSIELFLAVFYLGIWVYLRRLSYADYGNVDMPDLPLDDVFPCLFRQHMATIKRCMLDLPTWPWLAVFGIVFLGSWFALRPWATMDMVETKWVQRFTIACFSFAFLILWVNWFRFVAVWRCVREILHNLEDVPLRWAFTRLPRQTSMPIWSWSISDRSFIPAVQGVNIFRALVREAPSMIPDEMKDRFVQSAWEMNHPGLPWPHPMRTAEKKVAAPAAEGVRVAVLAASGRAATGVVEIVRELRALLHPEPSRDAADAADTKVEQVPKTSDGTTPTPAKDAFTPADGNTTARGADVLEMPAPTNAATEQPPMRASIREKKELLRDVRKAMTAIVNELSGQLIRDYWNRGATIAPKEFDQVPAEDRKYILAEDLVALRFYTYIKYVVSEMRNLLFFLVIAFSLIFVGLHVYAFRAGQALNWSLMVLFAVLATGVIWVLAQMEKDALLSRLQGSTAGQLNKNFYLDLVKYGIVPFFTVLGSQIPSLSNVLLRWVQPSLEAFR